MTGTLVAYRRSRLILKVEPFEHLRELTDAYNDFMKQRAPHTGTGVGCWPKVLTAARHHQ